MIDRFVARLHSPLIGAIRVLVGLLWLANMEWKRPPDFGQDLQNGLYKYVDSAVRNPVFPPYSWFVENVVLEQYQLFGWITLLLEAALCVCLLLGYRTAIAALVGAGTSVTILLSVLYYDKQFEWPWSYYLMIGIHLLLLAAMAGQHYGLDGLRGRDPDAWRRAATTIAGVAIAAGAIGLFVSADGSFAARQGDMVGWARGELKLLWFNPLSAVLTLLLGAALLVAVRRRLDWLGLAVAAAFALMTLQVIVQWRYNQGNWTGGVLGGTGATMAFWATLAVGAFVTVRGTRQPVSP
jgi:uncharacterized membrane protein YphA (DoxX/SURF4 family)